MSEDLDFDRRAEKAKTLLRIFNTVPAFVFDPLLSFLDGGMAHVSPILVEQLLERRGHVCRENESLFELVERVYGKTAADLIVELI